LFLAGTNQSTPATPARAAQQKTCSSKAEMSVKADMGAQEKQTSWNRRRKAWIRVSVGVTRGWMPARHLDAQSITITTATPPPLRSHRVGHLHGCPKTCGRHRLEAPRPLIF